MRRIFLKPNEALHLLTINAQCLANENDENDFVLTFEGHQKRIVGINITKRLLIELRDHIDDYLKKDIK